MPRTPLLKRALVGAVEATLPRLPAHVAGRLDYMNPSLGRYARGPMNGQRERQLITRQLFESIPFDGVLETGTFRGTTTEYLALLSTLPVATVEAVPRYYHHARLRLQYLSEVTVELGDSRAFLQRRAESPQRPERPFFYLDAHWYDDLPLADELRIIAASWQDAVVMIDDFRVPDDKGYGYDDYGQGRSLEESYLPMDVLGGWTILYPAAHSSVETGARQGSVVLLSPSLEAHAADLSRLRPSSVSTRGSSGAVT